MEKPQRIEVEVFIHGEKIGSVGDLQRVIREAVDKWLVENRLQFNGIDIFPQHDLPTEE